MTLDELQVVITANVAQIMPQVMEARQAFASLGQAAGTAGTGIDKSMSDSSKATQTALDKSNTAEKQSAQETQKATATKRQSLEEIAAIAEHAAKRYQDSISGMTGDGGPLEPPVALRSGSGLVTGSKPTVAATNTQPQLTALQRLQAVALRVRQSIAGMFSGAQQGAQGASAAMQELTAKLDNINARADIQRQKLASFQAEYDRVAAGAGGAGSDEAIALQEKILTTEARLQSLTAQSDKTAAAIRDLDAGLTETGSAATRAAEGAEKAGGSFRSASSGAGGFERGLQRIQSQIFRNLIVYGLLIKGIQSIGEYMWNALKTNTAFSDSLNNLKVQFLTAFQPIYQTILPALTALIQGLATAMNYIAALISGLFGKTYQQSKQSAAALNDNVKALQDTTDATKKLNDATLGIDELNIIKPDTTDKAATGDDASLVNTDFGGNTATSGSLIPQSAITAAQQAGEQIQKVFKGIYDYANKYLFTPIKADFSTGFDWSNLQKSLSDIGAALKPFSDNVGQGLKWFIDNVLTPLAKWVVNKALPDFLEDIASAINDINKFLEIFKPLGQWVWDNILHPIIEWSESEDVKIFGDIKSGLDDIGEWMDTHKQTMIDIEGIIDDLMTIAKGLAEFFAGVFTGNWKLAWKGIQDDLSGSKKLWGDAANDAKSSWTGIGPWFSERWADIQNAFKDTKSWFGTTFDDAKTNVHTAWSDIGTWFGGRWTDIQNAFTSGKTSVGTWFSNTFNTAYSDVTGAFKTTSTDFGTVWSNVRGAFSVAGVDVKTWFSNTFTSGYSAITTAFSGIGTFFGGIWTSIKGSFRDFLNAIIGGINTLASGVNQVIATISKVPGFSWAANLKIQQIAPITALATGGLAYAPTLAVVGDNLNASSNPEVVAPLDKLKTIMGNDGSENSERIIATLMNILDAVNSKDTSLIVDGRTVAKTVNKANRSMGASILGGAWETH